MAEPKPRFVLGKRLGQALVDAGILRLEDNIVRVTIEAPCDGYAKLHVERYLDERIFSVLADAAPEVPPDA